MRKTTTLFNCILLTLIVLTFTSCLVRKNEKLLYFRNVQNEFKTGVINTPKESPIKSSDILQINVFCSDDEINKKFLTVNNTPSSGSNSSISLANGYLVDDSGAIVLPLLGSVKAAGLSKVQLQDTIKKQLLVKQFALDPIVSVRVMNFKITFLGEVGKPGVILIPNERISITDAIALAGDLTINGRRDNILLIREKDGKKISRRFSLNNDEVFNSENFYLQNQDIIYVESYKYKASAHDRSSTTLGTIMTSVNFILLLYTTFNLINK